MYLIIFAAIMTLAYMNNKKFGEKISLKMAILYAICGYATVAVAIGFAFYLWLDDNFENFHPLVVEYSILMDDNWNDTFDKVTEMVNISKVTKKYTQFKDFFENIVE